MIRLAMGRAVALWCNWWFEVDDTRALELVRIGVAISVLILYASQIGHLSFLYSDRGWLPADDVSQEFGAPTTFSVLYRWTTPEAVLSLWAVLSVASAAMALGWQTWLMKWVVWLGHMSFVNRNPAVVYGVDDICSSLLFVLCFVPVGEALGLDRVRRPPWWRPWMPKWWPSFRRARASAGLRLIQLQMALVFLSGGTQKLRGDDWWDGDAVWYAMTDWEFSVWPLGVFAEHLWLVNALTYGALWIEISYAFLIWDRKTQPVVLASAILLHLGIGALMGLLVFGLAMIAGHMAFAPSAWLDRLRVPYPRYTRLSCAAVVAGTARSTQPNGDPGTGDGSNCQPPATVG